VQIAIEVYETKNKSGSAGRERGKERVLNDL
jgi:hypothetical protein